MYPGFRSKSDIVGMYVTRMQSYISNYWPAIDHPRVLDQAKRFVTKKRTKFDLICAWGAAEIGDMDNRYTEPDKLQDEVGSWAHNPYELA